jgi:hypothetical protein
MIVGCITTNICPGKDNIVLEVPMLVKIIEADW